MLAWATGAWTSQRITASGPRRGKRRDPGPSNSKAIERQLDPQNGLEMLHPKWAGNTFIIRVATPFVLTAILAFFAVSRKLGIA